MAVESMTEQFTKMRQKAFDSYWQTVEQVSETTERMTDSFLAAVPGLPAESREWLDEWRDHGRQNLDEVKEMIASVSAGTVDFKKPQVSAKKMGKLYEKNVDRFFEQIDTFRDKSRKVVEKVTDQMPEPGKQWLAFTSEMTDKGMDNWKAMLLGNVDWSNLMESMKPKTSGGSQQSRKPAGKSSDKSGSK